MEESRETHDEPTETMLPHQEQRAALPDHPVPAGLATREAWRLRVDGLVAQRLALSISEVEALGALTHTADVVCEEGWTVPAQPWDGVAMAAILGRAGVLPEARFLQVYTGDFPVLLPLEEVLTGRALVARRLNGTPLTPDHGAPLRLVAPGRACFSSVKWVERLEVLANDTLATGETLAHARGQRCAGRTRCRSAGVVHGVVGHEAGVPALCPSSRCPLVDRCATLAMVDQEGKEGR